MVDGNFDVTYPVLGIIGAVLIRYCVVSFAIQRSPGRAQVSYDLRQAFFSKLQQQGSEFFSEFSIGDMMTRAVADISLIQRLISMGTILLIIMVYATVVGFGFMLYYSPWLTLLLLPPMPLVFFYAQYSAKAMGEASAQVQDLLSDLGTHTQEPFRHSHHSGHGAGRKRDSALCRDQPSLCRCFLRARPHQFRHEFLDAQPRGDLLVDYFGLRRQSGTQWHIGRGRLRRFLHVCEHGGTALSGSGFIVNLFQRAGVASRRLFEVFDRPAEIADEPAAEARSNLPAVSTFAT